MSLNHPTIIISTVPKLTPDLVFSDCHTVIIGPVARYALTRIQSIKMLETESQGDTPQYKLPVGIFVVEVGRAAPSHVPPTDVVDARVISIVW
jgi:hypothetical protein